MDDNDIQGLRNKRMSVSVLFDVVKIEVHCGDDYEAQVLFDDITDRLNSGERLYLDVTPKGRVD